MNQPLDNLAQIRDAAAVLLRKANVDERLPTPVDDLVAAAGLVEDAGYMLSESKIRRAPREIRRLLRAAGRKVRGVLDRRERILHVNPAVEVPAQRQFIRCHETMHDVLPWQRELLVLGDTGKTLSLNIEFRFEQEANQGGAELLFQLDLLKRIARDYPTDITTPVALADMFGASIHSTFRRWIEHHDGAVCGTVLNPDPVCIEPLTFQRYEEIASERWRSRFGQHCFPARLSAKEYPFVAPLGPPRPPNVDSEWNLIDLAGSASSLRVQSFNNSYRTFVLLWLPTKEGFIARHRQPGRLVAG